LFGARREVSAWERWLMISTGTLMLGKALLTAGAVLGFCVWQLALLRRMRKAREQERQRERSQVDDQ
jgi:hypothetical protein